MLRDVFTPEDATWIYICAVHMRHSRIPCILHGKALSGNLKGLWRYRIGDYRLIADIQDNELVIVAIDIGHRREIYR